MNILKLLILRRKILVSKHRDSIVLGRVFQAHFFKYDNHLKVAKNTAFLMMIFILGFF